MDLLNFDNYKFKINYCIAPGKDASVNLIVEM